MIFSSGFGVGVGGVSTMAGNPPFGRALMSAFSKTDKALCTSLESTMISISVLNLTPPIVRGPAYLSACPWCAP